MYLEYFGLEKEPFTISPDPSFLYPSPLHRKALAHLKYGLEREGGFILLTGEVGTGKTTLTRLLLQQLPGNIRVAYILNARLGEQDLMVSICQELGINADPYKTSVREYTDLLNKDLLRAHADGKKTLVVIEEAQNLEPSVLEMLRLLTNLETNTTKLLHILLVAQPELLDVIGRPELRQLNQRVVSRYHLQPLSLPETSNYLRHRMLRAGCKRPVFDKPSVAEIHRLSGGVPRLINLLSERSLLGAFALTDASVTRHVVKNAAQEVFGSSDGENQSVARVSPSKLFPVAVLMGLLAVGIWYFGSDRSLSEPIEDRAQDLLSGAEEAVVAAVPIVESESESVLEAQSLPNAYTQLLARWSIEQTVTRQAELCRLAEQSGLQCHTETNLGFDELIGSGRPGVIRMQNTDDQFSTYLLSSVAPDQLRLSNTSGEQTISSTTLLEQWDGSFLYIWQPPSGYVDYLAVGVKNPPVVDWLQQRLAEWDSEYEEIITGGLYSSAISEQVKRFQVDRGIEPDGILGRATVMSLNDMAGESPIMEAE